MKELKKDVPILISKLKLLYSVEILKIPKVSDAHVECVVCYKLHVMSLSYIIVAINLVNRS